MLCSECLGVMPFRQLANHSNFKFLRISGYLVSISLQAPSRRGPFAQPLPGLGQLERHQPGRLRLPKGKLANFWQHKTRNQISFAIVAFSPNNPGSFITAKLLCRISVVIVVVGRKSAGSRALHRGKWSGGTHGKEHVFPNLNTKQFNCCLRSL